MTFLIYIDDPLDEEKQNNPEQIKKVKEWFNRMKRHENDRGRTIPTAGHSRSAIYK